MPEENSPMPATLSERELSDLDFTDTVVMRESETNEAADPTEHVLKKLDYVIDLMALKVEFGSTDERLWRILAGVYMALERLTDYSDLARKHLSTFGRPLQLEQPGVTFALPAKVNFDDIPKLDMILSACALPGGATIDFGAVRRLSAGGLISLSELLLALVPIDTLPKMRGIEAFIGSIEDAVKTEQGSGEMRDLLAAYQRFCVAHPKQRSECAVTAAA
jgi:hypothetical protein